MSTIKTLVYSFLIIAMFVTPASLAMAQSGFVPCNGLECNTCHIVEMGNTILNWLIGVLFVVFAVVVAMAGWGLVTSAGNQAALNDAKSKFTNAFIGLLIVLAAWLIVDTIMRALLTPVGPTGPVPQGEIAGFGPWSRVECVTPRTVDWRDTPINIMEEDTALISAGLATTTETIPVVANCGFDESSLVSIPGEGGHRAVAGVANRYVNMRNAASGQGISLSLTSSYRSDARQTQLWDQCPRCQRQGSVARPCSRGGGGSRHSSGVALDISSSAGRAGRCDVVRLCRSAGASFIMLYGTDSNHVHCDWGGRSGEVNVSC